MQTDLTRPVALSAHGLGKEFRGYRALTDVDLTVHQGDIHALIGPNGAGKSTLVNVLTGFLRPTTGTVAINGRDAGHLRPEQVARLGVARSFQITSLFDDLSCREHVELALQADTGWGGVFWRAVRLPQRVRARATELLEQVGLASVAGTVASALAYGQKRALELAMALARDARVMFLDEPTAGMGLEDVSRTVELIKRVRGDRTIVLVEHNMKVVAGLADRVTVLQRGTVLAEGSYDEVRQNPQVISAYLGGEHAQR